MKVEIEAGSRIHLGFIDPFGVSGRRWGSVGLYLDKPSLSMLVEKSRNLSVQGPEWMKEVASTIKEKLKIDGLKVMCKRHIPRHVGLGSGTQTILALGLATSRLYGLDLTIEEMARMFDRAKMSGAGYWLFQKGGLVVDGGKTSSSKPPPLLFRYDFPDAWRILLAIPTTEGLGLHSRVEEESISKIRTEPDRDASSTVLMKLLPSLVEEDFEEFTGAIEELDRATSMFFKDVQSGTYHPLSKNVVELFRRVGVNGVGQSSWGPTIYGFLKKNEVEEVTKKLPPVNGFKYLVTSARNSGARVFEL